MSKVCRFAVLMAALMFVHCAPSCFAQVQGMDDFQKGTAAYGQKNYAVAIGHFTQAAQKGNVTATYYLAMCHLGLKQDVKAVELFRHISKTFPGSNEADLANTYLGRLAQQATESAVAAKNAPIPVEHLATARAEKLTQEQWKTLPQSARIPFHMQNGHMHVKAQINGKWVDIIFDTGATTSCISAIDFPDLFSAAQLEKAERINVQRPHGVAEQRMLTGEMTVDKLSRVIPISVSYERGVSLIGQNFINGYSYEVDGFYIRLTKLASAPGSASSATVGKAAPATKDRYSLPFTREADIMLVDLKINGKPIKAVFDTGCAPDGIILPYTMLKTLGIQKSSTGFSAELAEIGPITRRFAKVYPNFGSGVVLVGPNFFGDRRYTVDTVNNLIKFQY